MIDLLIALTHPLTLALILGFGFALDLWLITRKRREASPPDTP